MSLVRIDFVKRVHQQWHIIYISVLLLVGQASLCNAMSLVIHAPPHQQACVYFRTIKGQDTVIRGSYEIINDKMHTPLPMTVKVLNGQKTPMYTSPHNSHLGTFDLLHTDTTPKSARLEPQLAMDAPSPTTVSSERWSVCIENGKPNLYHPFHWDREQAEKHAKLVSLSIVLEPKHPPGFENLSLEQQTQQVVLGNMAHKFDDLLHHMNSMRVREAEHRILAEETFSGLVIWTLVLFFGLLLVAVGQVLSIMRFFQAQKKMYY